MRVTLAKLLAESVTEVEIFGKATSIDPNTYITWIDKYQVTGGGRDSLRAPARADRQGHPLGSCVLCLSGPACGPVGADSLVRERGGGSEQHRGERRLGAPAVCAQQRGGHPQRAGGLGAHGAAPAPQTQAGAPGESLSPVLAPSGDKTSCSKSTRTGVGEEALSMARDETLGFEDLALSPC